MSFIVNLNDSLGTSLSNSSSMKRTNSPIVSNLGIFRFIRRVVYFRRASLLKLLMATTVILLILFLLFRPSRPSVPLHHEEQDKIYDTLEHETKISDVGLDATKKSVSDLTKSLVPNKQMTKVLPSVDPFSLQQSAPSYPNNLTYSLTARDFISIRNNNLMQLRIRQAAKHSWDNYRRYAWGFDMLRPRAKEAEHWFHLGLTIVDCADTLIMMGLEVEANLALDWIENDLNFNSSNENSNCFELTIRILAGILSVYHLTAREKLKQQAIKMGDILMHCYDTESKIIPYSDIDLSSHRAHPPQWNPHSSLSEVASLQLEFRYLSQITGNKNYEQRTFSTSLHLHNLTVARQHKLLPMYINPRNGQLEESVITLGARADSYYEYLLKQYLQTGIKWLEDDYLDCVDEIGARLLRHTNGVDNYTYVSEIQIYRTSNDTEEVKHINKMDHLVCFLPGTLALGYYHFSPLAAENRLRFNLETPNAKLNPRYNSHLQMAESLARTCYHMYSKMGTGLSPEIATFVQIPSEADPLVQNVPELQVQPAAAHNILRPEFVESLFYLYHITGMPKYRNQAEKVFEAFEKYSKISSGYSAISDVRERPASENDIDELLHKHAPDRMESFWLSETLKYLYLTFCDDKRIVGTLLNNYVFNTEAHLMPIV